MAIRYLEEAYEKGNYANGERYVLRAVRNALAVGFQSTIKDFGGDYVQPSEGDGSVGPGQGNA